jgi:hypothetical protein
MAFLQPLADPILNWLKGVTMPAAPAELWLSLHNGEPPTALNEISANVGGRVKVVGADFSTPAQSAGVDAREIVNTRAISFGAANTQTSVRAWGVWSASTGGVMYLSGDVIPDVLLRAQDPALFSTGDLIIRVG